MNKNIISILLIVLINLTLFSQQEKSFKFIPVYELNEKKLYKLIKIKNNLDKQSKMESLIEISVIKKSDEEITLKWTYKSIIFSDGNNDLTKLINDLYKNYTPEYKIDKNGCFIELINFTDLKNTFNNLTGKILGNKKSSYSKEKTKKILNTITSDDKILSNLFAKDILIFHNADLNNKEFVFNESYSFFTNIPNIWNNEPFIGLISFEVIKNDDNSVNIKINQEVDKDKSYNALTNIINNLLKEEKTFLNNNQYDNYIKDIDIKESYDYKINNLNSWFTDIYCKKTIIMLNKENSEDIHFLLID